MTKALLTAFDNERRIRLKVYKLQTKQQLPISLEEAWTFFSDPGKLPELSPSWMHFRVTDLPDGDMYPGLIATYSLKPLLGIRLNWVTEITHIKEHEFFIDEQRFGPYRFWHHEHRFKEISNGVEIIDTVHYTLPMGVLGRIAHKLNVEKKLHEVFIFRYKTLENLFGSI